MNGRYSLTAKSVLDDPSASDWLKRSLREALERDAVDAANDAEVLAEILGARCVALSTQGGRK